MNIEQLDDFDLEMKSLDTKEKSRYASVELIKALERILENYQIGWNYSENPIPDHDYEIKLKEERFDENELIETVHQMLERIFSTKEEGKPTYEFLEVISSIEGNTAPVQVHTEIVKDFLAQRASLQGMTYPVSQLATKNTRDTLLGELQKRQYQAHIDDLENDLNEDLDFLEMRYGLTPNSNHPDDIKFGYEVNGTGYQSKISDAYFKYYKLAQIKRTTDYDGIRMFLEYLLVAEDSGGVVDIPKKVVEVYTYDKNALKRTPINDFMIDWGTNLPESYILRDWTNRGLSF